MINMFVGLGGAAAVMLLGWYTIIPWLAARDAAKHPPPSPPWWSLLQAEPDDDPAAHQGIHRALRSPWDLAAEDRCPCPQEPCGYMLRDAIDPSCREHAPQYGNSFCTWHRADKCPGAVRPKTKYHPGATPNGSSTDPTGGNR